LSSQPSPTFKYGEERYVCILISAFDTRTEGERGRKRTEEGVPYALDESRGRYIPLYRTSLMQDGYCIVWWRLAGRMDE